MEHYKDLYKTLYACLNQVAGASELKALLPKNYISSNNEVGIFAVFGGERIRISHQAMVNSLNSSILNKVKRAKNQLERVCSDIYSSVNRLNVTEGSIDTYVPIVCGNKNMSVNLSLSAAEAGISPERKIAFSFACAYPEKISVCEETGRESIVGKVVFKIITVDDSSEENDYDCKEVTAPFKYDISRETAAGTLGAPIFLHAEAYASRTLSRFDGERAGLDTEVSLAFFALKKQKNTGIVSVSQGEKIEKNNEYIRIIYPAKGDSLWSIAKKMNVPTGSLAAKNGLKTEAEKNSPASISEVKYLIL